MNRTQQVLSVLVVLQIILAAVLFWPDSVDQNQEELLFGDISPDQIIEFSIEDEIGKVVAFSRTDSGWEISNTDGYPANAEKIDPVIEKMLQVKTGRLVASKQSSYDRLSVAEDNFLRRVWFKDLEGNEQVFYIGSAVAAGATHVRKAGDKNVYLTDKISPWEYGSAPRSWTDVVYLEIPREQMISMILENASGKLEFEKIGTTEEGEETWILKGLAEGEEFNQNNLVSMLTRLTNLQMDQPLGKEELAEYGLDNPSAVVTLTYQSEEEGEQTVVLRIGALDPNDNQYFVHASNNEYYAKIVKYSLQDFVERTKANFLVAEEAEE